MVKKWLRLLSFGSLICVLVIACEAPRVVLPQNQEDSLVQRQCTSVDACAQFIQTLVSRNWIIPDALPSHLVVRLHVELDSEFRIENVKIAESSGDREFDQSAINAIEQIRSFTALGGLDRKGQMVFRSFSFDFSPDVSTISKDPDKVAYLTAFQLLKNEKYEDGAAQFSRFIENYPQSTLIDRALFWLGESNLVLSRCGQAERTFKMLIETYPDSSKLPGALLGLGNAEYCLGKNSEAKRYFGRLIQDYANSDMASIGRKRLEKIIADNK